MIILLDAGHGIETPGKCSPDKKLKEYKYCREIMDAVYDEFDRIGYTVYKIPENEQDMSLSRRCVKVNNICSKFGANNCLLVSIHCNAAGDGSNWMSGTGFEVWTSKGKTKSDTLAECFYKNAQSILKGIRLRKDTSDGDSDKESNFYILKNTRCPAVLTENLFMDNKNDVEYLLSDKGKESIINLHIQSILDYINMTKK